MDKDLPSLVATSSEILNALRTVLDLPECITSLDLSLRMDSEPAIHMTVIPTVKYDG
jgi:hypothetical protein